MKNKVNIPKNWDEVYIDQFIELDSINLEQFESVSAVQLERLSILTDTSSDDDLWDDMDIREMNKLVTDLKFLSTKPSNTVYKKIIDDEFMLIDQAQNSLTTFQFFNLMFSKEKDKNLIERVIINEAIPLKKRKKLAVLLTK